MSSNQKQSSPVSGFADKKDRVRRMKILRNHREWPRRIIRAVREGSICLDMTREHVIASWGEPLQEGRSFMLGVGEHSAMFFRSDDCGISAVYLVNGKVTGWSSCRQEGEE